VLQGEVGKFAVIAVNFPKFADGRGYSIAYNLRARLGYTGELRAIGFIAHIKGVKSYSTVEQGLLILKNLAHLAHLAHLGRYG
jgi:hypothetical protein